MEDVVLSSLETVAELNRRIPRILRAVVGLFGLSDDGRAIAKGTGVLVRIGSRRLVFTASHVVTGTTGAALPTVLCLFPLGANSEAVTGCFLPPQMFDVSSSSIVWMNKELDVAVLAIPELEEIPVSRFVDGEGDAIITRTKLKPRWREFTSDDAYVPFMVCGFPNLGVDIDFDNRCHIVSCLPSIAEISSWDDSVWTPGDHPPPQCHFDLSSIDSSPAAPDLSPWDTHIEQATRLTPSEIENEAFGGISGGPVFCIETGEFLCALVKEGGRVFGPVRVIASSWDDVYYAFLDAELNLNRSAR